MVKFEVNSKNDNKKLIQVLKSKYENLPQSTIYKALRNKDIKVNGVRIKENITLYKGDEVEVYIKDDILTGKNSAVLDDKRIVYEDDNILVYDKPQNLEVLSSDNQLGLQDLLKEKYGFIKACHRIDRNTMGLVIFAKNEEAECLMVEMIKNRVIKKYYLARVYGIPKNKKMTLKAYLYKDNRQSQVIISDVLKKGYKEIITRYRVVEEDKSNGTSLLEVELITGKTHQIRAHLAHIGYPILGDGKYGINAVNKSFGLKYQELYSYKIVFEDAYGILSYLKNKEISLNVLKGLK